MDSEFPDPDEEYEMRYADEIELMKELGINHDKMCRSSCYVIILFTHSFFY